MTTPNDGALPWPSGSLPQQRHHALAEFFEPLSHQTIGTQDVPHSLRQGVEVIEFQTPVYERLILAASQPVQTQNHWDSAAATDAMHLAPQPPPRPTNTEPRQTLATAHTFEVTRHIVAKGATLPLPAWCVGWTARGELRAPDTTFTARQAFLAPRPATLVAVETSEVLTARETA